MESGETVEIQALACSADIRTGAVTCAGENAGAPAEGLSRIVLNPLGRWVRLTNGASSYADEILTYDATVQNLIPQTLGVDRNSQPDGGRVRVFFSELPTVTEAGDRRRLHPAGAAGGLFRTGMHDQVWKLEGYEIQERTFLTRGQRGQRFYLYR